MMAAVKKPYIIPIFIPHRGCPHQCGFCNQHAITASNGLNFCSDKIEHTITHALKFVNAHHGPVQIAFYGGNFLGLSPQDITTALSVAEAFVEAGHVHALRFSTRPDSISVSNLEFIKGFSVAIIELGAQAMHNHILTKADRGHTVQDTVEAVTLLRKNGYQVGLQMMVGLPGDNYRLSMDGGSQIADLNPDFVRIYPTVVLKGSPFAKLYLAGEYKPMPLGECVILVKDLYLLFKKRQIPVIRMGLQASEDLDDTANVLAGPYHPSFGHLVFSQIFLDQTLEKLAQKECLTERLTILVHPRSISKMRGLRNRNIEILKNKFSFTSIHVKPMEGMALNAIEVL